MVKVIKQVTVTNGEEQTTVILELTDGSEGVKCCKTGQSLVVPKKSRLVFSTGEDIKHIIEGATLKGYLVKVPMAPYQYRDPGTRQILTLNHGYAYLPKIGKTTMLPATRIGEF